MPGDVVTESEKRGVVSELEQALAVLVKPGAAKEGMVYYRRYMTWWAQQPAAVYMPLENAIKQDMPGLQGEALYRALVERIPQV